MKLEDLLTIIGLFLIYTTGLIGVYVNLRVKMKELEIKLASLSEELAAHKLAVGQAVKKLEERNTLEHDSIIEKMDKMLEKIIEIRVEQGKKRTSKTI